MYPSLPPKEKLPFMLVSCVFNNNIPKAFQKAIHEPWFAFLVAQTNVKTAADHVLTIACTIAHLYADINTDILIFHQDGSAREVVYSLKGIREQEGIRKIKLLRLEDFKHMLNSLNPGIEFGENKKTDQSLGLMQGVSSHLEWQLRYKIDEEEKFEDELKERDQEAVSIYHSEGETIDWEQRFQWFRAILYKTYIEKGEKIIRLSTLGKLVRTKHIIHEKVGFSKLLKNCIESGFMYRQGSGGEAAVVLLKEAFERWYESSEENKKLCGLLQ
jgi:hypothetical protein